MRNRNSFGEDDRDVDRRLDRDLEREGGYRDPKPRNLNQRGTLRARFADGVVQPPTRGGRP